MAVQPTNQSSPSANTKPPARVVSAATATSSVTMTYSGIDSSQATVERVPDQVTPTVDSGATNLPFSVNVDSSNLNLDSPTVAFELVNQSDDLNELHEPEPLVFGGELLGRCKSWMTSMVLHLVVIISLALFSMNGKGRPVVTLEMYADDIGSMMALEDLEFESASSEWEEANTEPAQQEVSEEALELSNEIDLLQDTLSDSLDTTNPMLGDPNILAKASRDMSTDILNLSGGDSSFFGIETTGDSIVYIVDRSGSMQGNRWINATRELVKSIESLKPEQKFYVYLFSSSCHPMPRMVGNKSKEMPFATKDNIKRFKKWLFRQNPSGSTMPLAAIKRAIRQEPATIFLLTDGQIYDDTGDYLLERAMAQRTVSDPDELVINTIAFHCQVGLEMLMDIATVYEGTFRSVE